MDDFKKEITSENCIFSSISYEKRYVVDSGEYFQSVFTSKIKNENPFGLFKKFLKQEFNLNYESRHYWNHIFKSFSEGVKVFDPEGKLIAGKGLPYISLLYDESGKMLNLWDYPKNLIEKVSSEFEIDKESAESLFRIRPGISWQVEGSIELFFLLLCGIGYSTENKITSFPSRIAEVMAKENIVYSADRKGFDLFIGTKWFGYCPWDNDFELSGEAVDSHNLYLKGTGIEIKYSNIRRTGGVGIKSKELFDSLIKSIGYPFEFDFSGVNISVD